jgi:site-specific recombinase XerD
MHQKLQISNEVIEEISDDGIWPEAVPLTYEALFEVIRNGEAATASRVRNLKSCIKAWCAFHQKTMSDTVGDEFDVKYEQHLTDVSSALLAAKPKSQNSKNVRWAAGVFRQAYQALRTSSDIPVGFLDAITFLCARKGWTTKILISHYRKARMLARSTGEDVSLVNNAIYNWFEGKALPKRGLSESALQTVADLLEVHVDILLARAFNDPVPILKLKGPEKNAYRANQSVLSKSLFSVVPPDHIVEAFNEHVAWKFKSQYRIDGENYVIRPGNYWTKDGTVEKFRKSVRDFFSFLMLPAPSAPEHTLTKAQKMLAGKGMAADQLRYPMLVDADLVWEYLEFKRIRQVNNVYTQESMAFILFINNLVNHPYSFLRAHAKFGSDLTPPIPASEWQTQCNSWHQGLLKLSRAVKKGVAPEKQRDPDTALRPILDHPEPVVLLREMISRMRAGISSTFRPHKRAAEHRDALLFELMILEPLRASHWGHLEIGEDFVRNEDGLWVLTVDKAKFKNKSSPWCRDRRVVFGARVSAHIDEYVNEDRQHLKGGKERDNKRLFLKGKTGPKPPANSTEHPYAISEAALWWIVAGRFETYFGMKIGTNAFRHILATAFLKKHPGDYEGAASILNNSPDVVKKNYGHLTQKDHLDRVNKWRNEEEAVFLKKKAQESANA